jgi:hypothetical protein
LRFDTYNVNVVIVSETDEDEVREMFLRLQNGTTLPVTTPITAKGAPAEKQATLARLEMFLCGRLRADGDLCMSRPSPW